MPVYNLSWSAFETYAQCPYRFKEIYLNRKREASNKYALFGCAIHELLDQIYEKSDFVMANALKSWLDVLTKMASKKEYDGVSRKSVTEMEDQGRTMIRKFFKLAEEESLLKPCVEHEVAMEGNYRECVLRAKVDLVTGIKGGLGIVDWKTGKPDPKNLMQLVLYAVLYMNKTGKKIDWIVPVYLKSKGIVYQALDKEIIAEATKYFRNIYLNLINDTVFLPHKNDFCYFCMFHNNGTCPLHVIY